MTRGIKDSFTVGYQQGRVTHIVCGVTSIVPNLNGVLMFTKDGRNHFIESYDMNGLLGNMFIEYADQEVIVEYYDDPKYVVHDHRC